MSCNCSGAGPSPGQRTDFQYAVKIVCGQMGKPKPWPLPPGRYFTATNVHNPSRCDTVTLRWKVAVALPGPHPGPVTEPKLPESGLAVDRPDRARPGATLIEAEAERVRPRVGPVTGFVEATLGPDEALEIDCSDVKARMESLGTPLPPYVKGWVVIECPSELDVVAVYGASTSLEDTVKTFHTERVPARCLPVCDDLDANLSTGVVQWLVKRPGAAAFVPATLGKLHPNWLDAPAGSLWISPGSEEPGDYVYRLSFKLCSGFERPELAFALLADDAAQPLLNGHPLTSLGVAGFSAITTWTAPPAAFRAGDNHLDIVVHNSVFVTGMALHGALEVARGTCPGAPVPVLACPEICYEVYKRHFAGGEDGWWSSTSCNGAEAGTTGQHRRLESLRARLAGPVSPGTTLQYQVHVKKDGWLGWVDEGQEAGTTGEHRRVEALEMRLVNAPVCCKLYYQVYTRKDLLGSGGGGWGPWVLAPGTAGTTGESRRVESVRMKIVCE